ncbi:MAG: mechanosensitive ion channel family protein [Phycisphaerae bacterium]
MHWTGRFAMRCHLLLLVFAAGLLLAAPAEVAGEAAEAGAESAAETASPAAPDVDLSNYFPEWAGREVFGVAVWQFLTAFACVLAGLALKTVSDYIFGKRLIPFLEKTRFRLDHLIARAASKPLGYLLLLAWLGMACAVLSLPEEPTDVRGFVYGVLKVLLVADVLWFLCRVVDVGVECLGRLAARTESKLDDQLVPLIRKALKVTIGLVCVLWVVQLLGYSVSSLLAGLGIGGLAVALALQDTLSNFFGSIYIFADRPFIVGDMVGIGDIEGTVEQIGFRSTRIRTWPATLVSIPNKTVAESVVDNWSKMPKRRVFQTVGVTYETTAEQMEKAVAAIRRILESDEGVDQEFIVVRFSDFGASSLDIIVYYFTKAIAYADHLAMKERVNLAIMRALRDLGLSIAFPTRTVYFEGDVARAMAGRRTSGNAERGA